MSSWLLGGIKLKDKANQNQSNWEDVFVTSVSKLGGQ